MNHGQACRITLNQMYMYIQKEQNLKTTWGIDSLLKASMTKNLETKKSLYSTKLFAIYKFTKQLIKLLLVPKLKMTVPKFLSNSNSKNVYIHFLCMISTCSNNGHPYRAHKNKEI